MLAAVLGVSGCTIRLGPQGEDRLVPELLARFPRDHVGGTFVEMGANNGLNSNTVQLEHRGWR